jgi:copper chaperone CopZ
MAAFQLLDKHPGGRMAAAAKVMQALYDKACEGDVAAIREWIDRLDGKASQTIELEGSDGQPVQLLSVQFVRPQLIEQKMSEKVGELIE